MLVGALAAAAAFALRGLPAESAKGLAAAGFVSAAASVLLAAARGRTRGFLWAYGGGAALRLAVLVALMAACRSRTGAEGAALLLTYVAGVFAALAAEALPALKGRI